MNNTITITRHALALAGAILLVLCAYYTSAFSTTSTFITKNKSFLKSSQEGGEWDNNDFLSSLGGGNNPMDEGGEESYQPPVERINPGNDLTDEEITGERIRKITI